MNTNSCALYAQLFYREDTAGYHVLVMQRTDLPKDLRAILNSIHYATIATVNEDGQPWNSPVVARFDTNMSMYWVSPKEAQHSQNIARDPRIFVVMYDSRVPEGQGLGLYMKMRANLLQTKTAIGAASQTYDPSFFVHTAKHPQFLGRCPQGFYQAIVDVAWYNVDAVKEGHFVDRRRAIVER